MKALVIVDHWIFDKGWIFNAKDSEVSVNMILIEIKSGTRVQWLDFLKTHFIVFPNDCKLLKLLEKV